MLNVIALMGRLTREPELRVTPGAQARANDQTPFHLLRQKKRGLRSPKKRRSRGSVRLGPPDNSPP